MANYGNAFQRTTPVVLNLIIINALAYFAQMAFGGNTRLNSVNDLFALHHYKADVFEPYQIITHMFMHGGIGHLLFNMFGLWMFGSLLERIWGPKKFLIFYLVCGITAALVQMGFYAYSFWQIDQLVLNADDYAYYQEQLRVACTVGASGAIMGLLGAFGYLFPNTELMVFPLPVPVKAKWVVTVIALIDIFGGVYTTGSGIAHFAHVGGLAMGLLLVFIWNKTNKRTFY